VHTTIKLCLKRLLHEYSEPLQKDAISWINNQVYQHSQIYILATRFLNVHLLRLLENNVPLPKIDKSFVEDVFKMVSVVTGQYNRTRDIEALKRTKELIGVINDANLPTRVVRITNRMAITYLTNFKNHFNENYFVYTSRYIKRQLWNLRVPKNTPGIKQLVYFIAIHVLYGKELRIQNTHYYAQQINAVIAQLRTIIRETGFKPSKKARLNNKVQYFYRLLNGGVSKPFNLIPQASLTAIMIEIDKWVFKQMVEALRLQDHEIASNMTVEDFFKFKRQKGKKRIPANYRYVRLMTDGVAACVTFSPGVG
jgi:hypothetical protein